MVGLMLANYTPTRCVNPCQPVFIHVWISIQRRIHSHLHRQEPVALKIWSGPTFNDEEQNVKLKSSTLQADKKLAVSVLINFLLIVTLCSMQWVASNTFVPVKKYVLPSLKRISNTVERKESSMNEEDVTSKQKDSLSFSFGSVIDGDCTRQLLLLNNKSEKISPTGDHRQINNS